jgi:hypothetical protein
MSSFAPKPRFGHGSVVAMVMAKALISVPIQRNEIGRAILKCCKRLEDNTVNLNKGDNLWSRGYFASLVLYFDVVLQHEGNLGKEMRGGNVTLKSFDSGKDLYAK